MIKQNVDTKLILEYAWQDESRIHFSFSVEVDDGCKIERTYVPNVVIPITEAVLKTSEFNSGATLILPDNELAVLKGYKFYSKKENDDITIDDGFYYVKEIIKEYPPVKMTVEDIEKKLGYKITIVDTEKQ